MTERGRERGETESGWERRLRERRNRGDERMERTTETTVVGSEGRQEWRRGEKQRQRCGGTVEIRGRQGGWHGSRFNQGTGKDCQTREAREDG